MWLTLFIFGVSQYSFCLLLGTSFDVLRLLMYSFLATASAFSFGFDLRCLRRHFCCATSGQPPKAFLQKRVFLLESRFYSACCFACFDLLSLLRALYTIHMVPPGLVCLDTEARLEEELICQSRSLHLNLQQILLHLFFHLDAS